MTDHPHDCILLMFFELLHSTFYYWTFFFVPFCWRPRFLFVIRYFYLSLSHCFTCIQPFSSFSVFLLYWVQNFFFNLLLTTETSLPFLIFLKCFLSFRFSSFYPLYYRPYDLKTDSNLITLISSLRRNNSSSATWHIRDFRVVAWHHLSRHMSTPVWCLLSMARGNTCWMRC